MPNEADRLTKARRDLSCLRIQYQGRRPAAETLLNEFELILSDAEAEVAEVVRARAHDVALQYQGRLQQAEKREDDARNLAEKFRVNNEALREAAREKRVLREARKREGSDVEVTIDREYNSPWTIADLEEIAYRLRAAGGTDDTEVGSTTQTFTAFVPDPNVVTLGQREVEPRPHPDTMVPEAGVPFSLKGIVVGSVFVIIALLGLIIALLGLTVR